MTVGADLKAGAQAGQMVLTKFVEKGFEAILLERRAQAQYVGVILRRPDNEHTLFAWHVQPRIDQSRFLELQLLEAKAAVTCAMQKVVAEISGAATSQHDSGKLVDEPADCPQ